MERNIDRIAAIFAAFACLITASAHTHHAFTSGFDVDRIVEVEGRVTELRWQNPHVLMTLAAADGTVWAVESQAKNLLERTEIFPTMFAPGTEVSLAGYPARHGNGVFALNALLPEGREVILRAGVAARFGVDRLGNPENILADGVADAAARTGGLFRVWSMQFAGAGRWRWPESYALTPAAEAARAAFDPLADNPLAGCGSKGMPWIMEQPFPMEIAERGSSIEIRLEEDDVVRVIHRDPPPLGVAPSPLGYSFGRRDGSALVVRTTGIDYPYLNSTGIPISRAAELEERFSVTADGSRLNYRLTVTDPVNLKEPLTLETFWVWRPGEQLQPYSCVRE